MTEQNADVQFAKDIFFGVGLLLFAFYFIPKYITPMLFAWGGYP